MRSELSADEDAVLRRALRSLFREQPDLQRAMLVRAYVDGEMSLGKAAQMMGISLEEMKEVISESGYEVHLGPESAPEVLEDAANA